MPKKKHTYTHVGLVRVGVRWNLSAAEPKEVWLRKTPARWYAADGRWWPKEHPSARPVYLRHRSNSTGSQLDLTSIRPISTDELRAPLARMVDRWRKQVDELQTQLAGDQQRLREAQAELDAFDARHVVKGQSSCPAEPSIVQSTGLYLLKLHPGSEDARDLYDHQHAVVVRACSESHAREIAANGDSVGDEGKGAWLDPQITTCEEMGSDGDTGVMISDFRAG